MSNVRSIAKGSVMSRILFIRRPKEEKEKMIKEAIVKIVGKGDRTY